MGSRGTSGATGVEKPQESLADSQGEVAALCFVLHSVDAEQTKMSADSMKADFPKPRLSGQSPPIVMNNHRGHLNSLES